MAGIYKQIQTSRGPITLHRKFVNILNENNLYINVGNKSLTINTKSNPKQYVGLLRAIYSRCMADHLDGRQIVGFRNGNKCDYHKSNLIFDE